MESVESDKKNFVDSTSGGNQKTQFQEVGVLIEIFLDLIVQFDEKQNYEVPRKKVLSMKKRLNMPYLQNSKITGVDEIPEYTAIQFSTLSIPRAKESAAKGVNGGGRLLE